MEFERSLLFKVMESKAGELYEKIKRIHGNYIWSYNSDKPEVILIYDRKNSPQPNRKYLEENERF